MSRFSQQLRKIPKDRQTLRNFYAFFSAIWVAGILAYAFGYWRMISNMGGHMSFFQWIFVCVVICVPLIVVWFPYWLTREMRFAPVETGTQNGIASLDPEQLREISTRLEALSSENKEVRLALGDILSGVSAVVHSGESASQTARHKVQSNFDAPILPLAEQAGDHAGLNLADVATALDFTDQVQKGDWAIAFERVQTKGSFLELMRSAEKVIDVFEEEGIFVEDIAIAHPPEHAWRALAKNIRNAETEKLAYIPDLSAKTLIKSRLKSDANFQEISLRFQKRFIDMLEKMAPKASGNELDALAKSRAGRAFAILGGISQTFVSKDRA